MTRCVCCVRLGVRVVGRGGGSGGPPRTVHLRPTDVRAAKGALALSLSKTVAATLGLSAHQVSRQYCYCCCCFCLVDSFVVVHFLFMLALCAHTSRACSPLISVSVFGGSRRR